MPINAPSSIMHDNHATSRSLIRRWRPGTSESVTPPLTGSIKTAPPLTSLPRGVRHAPLAGMSSVFTLTGGHVMCRANPQPTSQITTPTQPTHTNIRSPLLAHGDHTIQVLPHEPPSRPQSPPPLTPTPPYAPTPHPPTLHFHGTPPSHRFTLPSHFHTNLGMPWTRLSSRPKAASLTTYSIANIPRTVKTLLPIRQKNLVPHAITLTIEEIVRGNGLAKNRWLAILHLIPRLLPLTSIHTRHIKHLHST